MRVTSAYDNTVYERIIQIFHFRFFLLHADELWAAASQIHQHLIALTQFPTRSRSAADTESDR
jgi:hypothetical protein